MTPTNTTSNQADNDTSDRGRLGAVGDKVSETYSSARERSRESYEAARERSRETYDAARQRAGRAYEATREGVDSYPVAALLGGLAIGALAATLIPRTEREARAMGAVGRRLTEKAREAGTAAKEAGVGKLDELGLNAEGARQKLSELASTAGEAAKTSAAAAAGTVRSSGGTESGGGSTTSY